MARWTRPTIERTAAAGILVLAVLLAWLIVDRPIDTSPAPQRQILEQPKAVEEEPHGPAATVAAIAGSLAIEIVQIADPPAPAATPTAAPAPPAPPPTVVVEAPPPPRAPEPKVEQFPAPRPAPASPPEVLPLRPSRAPPVEPEVIPVALKPESQAVPDVVPLRPTPPQPKAETPNVERPTPPQTPRVPNVTPLRPSPPKPVPLPETKVVERMPAPRPPPPAPKAPPQKTAPPKPSPEANVAMVVGEGRAFLKILEQGAGPGIEIRWPAEASQRDRLYDVLVQCLGMRTGVLDGDGRLYLGDAQKGQPSLLDGERYSGFVRRPEGVIARDEEREIGRVRSYHQVRASASAARIFPRRVDAYLIGGLRQLVGESYLQTKSIRASYRLRGGQPIVESIVADGRRIDGVIELAAVANSCSH